MKVTDEHWRNVAGNLQRRREERPITPNISLYKKIVDMVHVGRNVLDVGAGQCYLQDAIGLDRVDYGNYYPMDPFPTHPRIYVACAEDLGITVCTRQRFCSVFMLAALDNVKDVKKALDGLKRVALENIVILTGIDIEPDQYHTHKITRQMLVDVLGKPSQEVEMLPKLFLFEWKV